MGHYRMGNEADYHKVGDVLAPKDIWKDLYPDVNDSIGVGDLSIRIQRGPRGHPTTKDVLSLPSSTKLPCALYLAYNDHHEILEDRDRNLTSAERAVEVINNDWDSSQADALRVFDGLISGALKAALTATMNAPVRTFLIPESPNRRSSVFLSEDDSVASPLEILGRRSSGFDVDANLKGGRPVYDSEYLTLPDSAATVCASGCTG